MYQSIPQTPSHTRVFTACLLSFMILIAPIASVAAATIRATEPAVNKTTKKQLSATERLEAALFEPALPVVGPVITATKVDSFPSHPSGQAEPGDAITYDVNIQNTGTDATGVNFTDTIDPNTTLVAGSLKVSPLAFADTYNTSQDTPLNQVAPGVLTNDTGLPAPTVAGIVGCADVTTPFVCATTHGSVTLNADGSFTYTPALGFSGTDTFDYTASNGLSPNDTATATITIADVAPTVSSTTPTNGATGVAANSDVTVTFTEPVTASAGAFTISCATSGAHTSVVTGGPTTFTINPNVDFTQGELCTVTVVAAQIADNDANDPPDNMAANFVFSFTTDAAPSVTATTPTNGATNQTTNTDITLTFSESVSLGATPVTISCTTSGAHTSAVSASPNTTFTVNPNVDFAAGETCTVTVLAAQVTDTDTGDPPDNMTANFVFSFSIDAAPTVNATTPTNGATQVANNANVSITFSESVNLGATPVTISCATSGAHTSVVSASPNTTFTVNPDTDFANGELCTVTVLAAQVTDQDSNDPPDNMAANFVFSFTIDVPPSVTTTVPTNNATNIAQNSTVTINFSENVNVAAGGVTINCGSAVAFTPALPQSNLSSLVLTPTGGLPAGSNCTVTVVAANVTDVDTGDPPDNMTADYIFTFKVKPDAVNDTYPQTVIGNVSIDSSLIPYSVTTNDISATAFTVTAFDAASVNGGTVSVAANGTFTYNPPAGFEGTDTFTYTISRSDGGGSDTATVSIPVSGMIWFINNNASSCVVAGCGRLLNPFSTLAAFNTLNNGTGNNPAANDNIFIYTGGSNYTAPLTLLNNQRVIGQGATSSLATLAGVTVPSGSAALPATGGTDPTITNGAGNGFNLASGNQLFGLKFLSTTSTAINGGVNVGTLIMGDIIIDNSASSGAGIVLNNGGTSVTSSGINTINTQSATALNVTNTTIGAGGLMFRSISSGSGANSTANGIILDTTGSSGGLTVTGTGSAGTGGTIQNKTGADGSTTQGSGIFLNSTAGVSLDRMQLNGFQNYGIRGTSVTGFTLNNTIINGTNGTTAAGGSEEGAVRFDGLFTNGSFAAAQTASISNSTLGGVAASDSSFSDDLRVINSSGTLNRLTITNTNFGKISTGGNNGLTFSALTTASPMNLTVQDSFFTNAIGSLASITASNSTTMDVVIRRNKFSNNNVNQSSGGGGLVIQGGAGSPAVTYDVSCNTFRDAVGIALLVAKGNGSGAWTGSIINNTVGVTGVALSGSTQASGIKVKATGTNTHTTMIRNNVVRQTNEEGIFIQNNDGSATLNASVFGNTVAEPGSFQFAGINVDIGALGTDTSICNVVIGSAATAADKNDVSAGDPSNFSDVNLSRIAGAGTQLNLSKNGSASATAAGVIDDDNLNPATTNTGVSGTVNLVLTLPATPPAVAACSLPPLLFADGGIESVLNFVPLLSRFMGASVHPADCADPKSLSSLLQQDQLDSIVAAAIERWSAAGLTPQQFASLRGIKFEVSDLSGSYLGETDGNRILVDRNAQGKGWFVDANPRSDTSFSRAVSATRLYTDPMSAPAGHLDLLTAIEHEMGHKLGLDDSYAERDRDSIMYGYLTVGERRLPAPGQARGVNPIALAGTHYLSLPSEVRGQRSEVRDQRSEIRGRRSGGSHNATARATTPLAPPPPPTISQSIGTLKAGKTVHIQFQVTVNTPFPGGTTDVSNQGTVNYDPPGPPVLTDDPAVAGANDPTVTPILAAADAVDDAYNAFKNTPLNVPAPGVLTNDSGSPTVTAIGSCADVTAPFNCTTTSGGTLVVNSDGSFNYTPPSPTFTGADSFTYTATNGTNSDTATVNITVSDTSTIFINEVLFNPPGTDAPNEYIELRGTPSATIPAGTYFVAIEGDAADNPGDVQTIINLSGLTFGTNGFLVLLQNGNTYTTTAGATVITSTTTGFGGLPGGIWSADASATDIEDASVTFMLIQTGVAPTLTNDIDSNDDGAFDGTVFPGWSVRDSISAMDGGALGRAYGAFSFRNTAGTGTGQGGEVIVPFIPAYVGRNGDSTGSTAADWVASGVLGGAAPNWTLGIATETEPASFAGKALNHIGTTNFENSPPINTVPGAQNMAEDTTLTFNAANANLISIADTDAGGATVQVSLTATNGIISLSGTTGLSFGCVGCSGDGTSDASMVFQGTITDINAALDGLTFTPTLNFNGAASLQITTDDLGNSGDGGAKTDTDTVNITVNGVNDPPSFTIAGNPPAVNEDAGAQTVNAFATNISQGVGDSGQTLTFNITPTGTTGNIAFSSGPSIDSTTGNLTYTTSSDTNGTASFNVTLSDNGGGSNTSGTQSFTITVNAVNDAPSFQIPSNPPAVGEDAGAQTVNSFATNFQPGPVTATDEALQTLVGYTVTQTGTTGNLAFTSGPSINNAGTLTYTPTNNTSGTATFNVVATDSGSGTAPNVNQSAPVAFTITVNEGNDAPVNTVPGAQSTATNTALTFSAGNGNLISISDIDAGSNAVQVTLTATNGTFSLNGTTGLSFSVGDGTADATMTFTGTIADINTALNGLVFTPTAGFNGAASLQIITNDQGNTGTGGALSDTDTVNINVENTQVIQFNSATYTINEGAVNTPEGFASLTVQVDRTGDLSGAATVRYATADLSGNNECTVTNGNASQRCDYLMLSGTLRFAAGDASKTFQIPIVNDGYVEGPELFTIQLSNVTGTAATLGPATLTTVTITDDDTLATDAAHNPYLNNSFFVRMHYVDFLEREPDTAGFNDWVGVLDGCGPQHGFLGAPAGCDRAHISQGFFGATEFIDRGFLVYRLYDLGLNRLPLYTEFNADAAELRGFGLTPAEQQQNLDNYLLELGARTEFVNRYAAVAATGQASQLIDLLEMTAGVTLPATATTLPGQPPQYGRGDLISKRATGQFSVVETVKAFAEQKVVYDKYFPRGFVTMQYFGYLHRDPDAAGWNDWLDVLVNGRPSAGIAAGDYRHLIFGFIYSTEYRKRFGQP